LKNKCHFVIKASFVFNRVFFFSSTKKAYLLLQLCAHSFKGLSLFPLLNLDMLKVHNKSPSYLISFHFLSLSSNTQATKQAERGAELAATKLAALQAAK